VEEKNLRKEKQANRICQKIYIIKIRHLFESSEQQKIDTSENKIQFKYQKYQQCLTARTGC
jgi:hypothetical protein